jgi:hypothetical protein
VRFFLGPFVSLLARMAALSRFPVAILPLQHSADRPIKHIRRSFVDRALGRKVTTSSRFLCAADIIASCIAVVMK